MLGRRAFSLYSHPILIRDGLHFQFILVFVNISIHLSICNLDRLYNQTYMKLQLIVKDEFLGSKKIAAEIISCTPFDEDQ